MVNYTVQAGQMLNIAGFCGCKSYAEGDTVALFPAYAQYFVERGIIVAA